MVGVHTTVGDTAVVTHFETQCTQRRIGRRTAVVYIGCGRKGQQTSGDIDGLNLLGIGDGHAVQFVNTLCRGRQGGDNDRQNGVGRRVVDIRKPKIRNRQCLDRVFQQHNGLVCASWRVVDRGYGHIHCSGLGHTARRDGIGVAVRPVEVGTGRVSDQTADPNRHRSVGTLGHRRNGGPSVFKIVGRCAVGSRQQIGRDGCVFWRGQCVCHDVSYRRDGDRTGV